MGVSKLHIHAYPLILAFLMRVNVQKLVSDFCAIFVLEAFIKIKRTGTRVIRGRLILFKMEDAN